MQNKNVGKVNRDGSTARFIGFLIIALVASFGFLSLGLCAYWCRRRYKECFIEERRQHQYDDILTGQVYHGMYKNQEGDWEIAQAEGGVNASNDTNSNCDQ